MEVVKTGNQYQGTDSQVVPKVSSPRVGSAKTNERWESESLRAIALYNTRTYENCEEAEAILVRLANKGHVPSKIAMGDIYANKSIHWFDKFDNSDYDQAIKWYKEATLESALACYKLGKLYVKNSPELAWKTFCQGLKLNNEAERDACCEIHTQMGKMCLDGVYVERDVYQAE